MTSTRVSTLGTACIWCSSVLQAADWPAWRGPEQTGMTREPAPVTSWSPAGENLLWRIPLDARTTPVVMDGRLFAIAPSGGGLGLRERVLCLDANNGELLWEFLFNVFDTDVVENRLGWTAVTGDPETSHVYAHASGGEFFCLSRDGKLIWKRSLTEEFGRISGYGGRLHTPIVDENRVVISFLNSSWGDQARPTHRYLALDKKTGEVLWWAAPGGAPYDTTYAVPVVAVIGGRRMLIAPNADGSVYGMNARTGEKIWSYPMSRRGLNTSPVVDGNYVYVSHSEENLDTTVMGRVACLDASKTGDLSRGGEVWRYDGCEAGYASPALVDGRLYVVDNSADLYCFDAKTGVVHWRYKLGRVGKGSPIVTADGVIYVGEQNGVFHILKDGGDRCISLDREEFEGPDHAVDEIFGSPIMANGRVYFMTRYNTYCLGAKKGESRASPGPSTSEEASLAEKPRPLHLSPAEIAVFPGEEISFKILDHAGRQSPSGDWKETWTLAGVNGEFVEPGRFRAGKDNRWSAGKVVLKSTDFEASARVRVSPRIPFVEDFESYEPGGVPPGWLEVVNKTRIVERDGGRVLWKLAENPAPPFMRTRVYMTPPIAGGYTMEADVLGTPKGDRFRPDMGVINSRYFLMLMGGDQVLRLETWSAVPRIRHDVPFPWKTDLWYRMKCRVEIGNDRARILGKVWPRNEQEPSDWLLMYVDPYPHREGSPGLYGYSPGTTVKSKGPEVFFDNIRVFPNE